MAESRAPVLARAVFRYGAVAYTCGESRSVKVRVGLLFGTSVVRRLAKDSAAVARGFGGRAAPLSTPNYHPPMMERKASFGPH